jgi:hypothetical protein
MDTKRPNLFVRVQKMNFGVDTLQAIVIIMILCYIPLVCYSDIKTRTVKFVWYLPLIVIGTACLNAYLSDAPERNIYLLGLTVVLCLILLAASGLGAFGGSDFFFASFIMLFVQYNPFKSPRIFFALDFFWTLFIVMMFIPIILYAYNLFNPKSPTSFKGRLTYYPRGVPFMIPISFAFIATLIMEVLL